LKRKCISKREREEINIESKGERAEEKKRK
jgi:hypothetical protein